MNGGAARSSACQSIGVLRVRASRIESNGLRPFSAWSARRRSWSTRFSASSRTRRSGVEKIGDDADHAGGVEDVHRRLAVLRRDADGRVLLRGRRAADEERQLDAAALHLLRDRDHLVERRRDEPRQPDDVAVLLERDVEDPIRGNHDAEVDDVVAVAAEDDADDVLADVVDVALHGCHDDAGRRRALGLLGFHVRLEVRDGALHRAGALHDLREEHLPGAEEVADDLHPVHQRPLDHVERPRSRRARLLGVLLDEVDHAVDERVREPLADGRLAPGEIELALRRAARDGRGVLDETLRRILTPVEENVLDALEQIGLDVLVHGELAGVDDPHVEARR